MNRASFIHALKASFLGIFTQKKDVFPILSIKTNKICERCENWLGKSIVFQKGIKDVEFDFEKQIILVKYDSRKTNADHIRQFIASIGYDADFLKADIQKREILRECCFTNIPLCK